MRLTDQVPTPKAIELLMKNVLDSNISVEQRIQDATFLTVIQSRIDKVLDNFQQKYEEYVTYISTRQGNNIENEDSSNS